MERGVIQQVIQRMDTPGDVGLRLVIPFAKFPPKARKRETKGRETKKHINEGFLTCRLCLRWMFLTCRLCLQHIHTFPSNFTSNSCLLFSSKGWFLNADFVCYLLVLDAVFLDISLPVQRHLSNLFPCRIFGHVLQLNPLFLTILSEVCLLLLCGSTFLGPALPILAWSLTKCWNNPRRAPPFCPPRGNATLREFYGFDSRAPPLFVARWSPKFLVAFYLDPYWGRCWSALTRAFVALTLHRHDIRGRLTFHLLCRGVEDEIIFPVARCRRAQCQNNDRCLYPWNWCTWAERGLGTPCTCWPRGKETWHLNI